MADNNNDNRSKRPHNPYARAKRPRPSAASETHQATAAVVSSASDKEQGVDRTAASFGSPFRNTATAKKSPGVSTEASPLASSTPQPPSKTGAASALVIAAADKAGMEGIDRVRINAIILRESADSLYMQQQYRRDEKVNQRIAVLQAKLARQNAEKSSWKTALQKQVDQEVPGILAQRSARSVAVVVDMDMFYMACELLTRPELQEKPACVGGGMILTSNYKARRYGVRSAMAGWIGDKLVEELSGGKEKLMHVPSHFELYREKSLIVRRVLAEYDPHLRAYSLDEAYMDLGPYLALKLTKGWSHDRIRAALLPTEEESNEQKDDSETVQEGELKEEENSNAAVREEGQTTATWTRTQEILASVKTSVCLQVAAEVVNEMRQQVCVETGGLTCSAGVAPNFLLAKIASDYNKPDGQCLVGSNHKDVTDFLYPLQTRKVGGIGRVTEKTLNAFGILNVGDLYKERALVRFLFMPVSAKNLLRASLGCSSSDEKVSSTEEESTQGQRGISRERTFRSGGSWTDINSRLEDVGRMLSKDMKEKNLWAHTLTVKVKLHTFDCLSRSKSLPRGKHVQDAVEMVALATEALRELRNEFKGGSFNVRLLGIRCSNFQGAEERTDASNMNIEKFLESKEDAAARSPRSRSPSPFRLPSERTERSDQMKIEQFLCTKPAAVTTARSPQVSSPNPRRLDGSTPSSSTPQKQVALLSSPTQPASASALPATVVSVDTYCTAVARSEKATNECNNAIAVTSKQSPEALNTVHCPVCNRPFAESDNEILNQHVDACLNGTMVRQAVQESAAFDSSGRPMKKKQRSKDFFGRPANA